jgi:hypothetical protein
MNVQTNLENGGFRLAQPAGLDHSGLAMEVADGGLTTNEPARNSSVARSDPLPPEVAASAKAMEARIDAIRNAPFPDDLDLPPLTKKQLDRIAAFALRDEFGRGR